MALALSLMDSSASFHSNEVLPANRENEARFPVAHSRRWVLVLFCFALISAGVYGWFLAMRWHDRAEIAENEFRRIAVAFEANEKTLQVLEDWQEGLAAAKAAVEDEQIMLKQVNQNLVGVTRDLNAEARQLAQIATAYRDCAQGYAVVVRDMTNNDVSRKTQKQADKAVEQCQLGHRLAERLSGL